jgi:hypothetical protein
LTSAPYFFGFSPRLTFVKLPGLISPNLYGGYATHQMTNLLPRITPLLMFFLLILPGGCDNSSHLRLRAEALLQQAQQWQKNHASVSASIDSLWDATSAHLESSLPSDLPPVDRDIFLKSRNADHIRMFMSFDNLSPELQTLVNEAGRHDEMLAARMRDLALEKQELDKQKIQLLLELERENAGNSQYYADQFRTLAAQAEE